MQYLYPESFRFTSSMDERRIDMAHFGRSQIWLKSHRPAPNPILQAWARKLRPPPSPTRKLTVKRRLNNPTMAIPEIVGNRQRGPHHQADVSQRLYPAIR